MSYSGHKQPLTNGMAGMWSTSSSLLQVEEVGARQGLELVVLLPNRLSAHAAVQLHLLHAFVELHYMVTQFSLLPLRAIDPFTQAVELQQAKLHMKGRNKKSDQDEDRAVAEGQEATPAPLSS